MTQHLILGIALIQTGYLPRSETSLHPLCCALSFSNLIRYNGSFGVSICPAGAVPRQPKSTYPGTSKCGTQYFAFSPTVCKQHTRIQTHPLNDRGTLCIFRQPVCAQCCRPKYHPCGLTLRIIDGGLIHITTGTVLPTMRSHGDAARRTIITHH